MDEVKSLYAELTPEVGGALEECNSISKEIQSFTKMLKDLEKSLEEFNVTEDSDMSEVIGFSSKELEYLLQNSDIISNQSLIDSLIDTIPEASEKYQVNEIGALGVMRHETGDFQSSLCVDYNNYGGIMNANGDGRWFASKEAGIEKTVWCIHYNMKNGKSLYDINTTYCDYDVDGKYAWSSKVYLHEKEILNAFKEVFK